MDEINKLKKENKELKVERLLMERKFCEIMGLDRGQTALLLINTQRSRGEW